MNEEFDYSKTYYIITTKDERVVKDPDENKWRANNTIMVTTKDERVVKDPQGNKWRANNTIFGKKYHINNDFG